MKKLITFIFTLLLASNIFAQSLEVLQPLQEIPNSSVLVQYKNQFGKWNMPERDLTFPFALIRMQLDGSGTEVKAAKEYIQLDLGTQKVVTDQYRGTPNEIWFLIENTVKNVYISCGEGCEKQLLASGFRFIPNRVYVCKVKYTPEKIAVVPTQPQIHNQYLQFKVEPKDATIEVDGQIWKVEEGSARKFVEFGTYKYVVKAADYKTQEGTVVVNDPDNKQVVTINLEPNYAKLTFNVDNNAEIWIDEEKKGNGQWQGTLGFGQHQIITKLKGHRDNKIVQTITPQDVGKTIKLNAPTPIYGSLNVDVMPDDAIVKVDGIQVGTTPCVLRDILIGSHQVALSATGYKDYSTRVIISENQMQTLTAKLEKTEKPIRNASKTNQSIPNYASKYGNCNLKEIYTAYIQKYYDGRDINDDKQATQHMVSQVQEAVKVVSAEYGLIGIFDNNVIVYIGKNAKDITTLVMNKLNL